MPVRLMGQRCPDYPERLLACLGTSAPKRLSTIGSPDLLRIPSLALVSSVKCPGSLILKFYDMVRLLRDAGVTVIGGFHSPMEKEALDLLLRGRQPVIYCPAKGIAPGRQPAPFQAPVAEKRLLLLSFFGGTERRTTVHQATFRNECVVALAEKILFVHASVGGKSIALARKALDWSKPVFCIEDEMNEGLIELGVRPVPPTREGLRTLFEENR
jgi:predicted Rossmann fold nucleotide-binding protein DprA/Smf involved in DNA uptake